MFVICRISKRFAEFVPGWNAISLFMNPLKEVLYDRCAQTPVALNDGNSAAEKTIYELSAFTLSGRPPILSPIRSSQIDVEFSNSMIEALFRSLKHRWLFILSLTTFESVCRAAEEYLTDHNNRIPHYALGGAVPLEIFSGTWTEESRAQLSESSTTAAAQRIEFNRSKRCGLCPA